MNIEIRKLTFSDKDEMDALVATRPNGWWNNPWDLDERSQKPKFIVNWSKERHFDVNKTGWDHFGFFGDGELLYIYSNKYFNSWADIDHEFTTPLMVSSCVGKKTNKQKRYAKDGITNLSIIELQNYAFKHGNEVRGITHMINAREREWWPDLRAKTHDCIVLETIEANTMSKYEFVRKYIRGGPVPHVIKVVMFIKREN